MKNFKFIPRGLPRDKAMGDYQGGEAQLSPLGESGVHTPDEVKNLIHCNQYNDYLCHSCNNSSKEKIDAKSKMFSY